MTALDEVVEVAVSGAAKIVIDSNEDVVPVFVIVNAHGALTVAAWLFDTPPSENLDQVTALFTSFDAVMAVYVSEVSVVITKRRNMVAADGVCVFGAALGEEKQRTFVIDRSKRLGRKQRLKEWVGDGAAFEVPWLSTALREAQLR